MRQHYGDTVLFRKPSRRSENDRFLCDGGRKAPEVRFTNRASKISANPDELFMPGGLAKNHDGEFAVCGYLSYDLWGCQKAQTAIPLSAYETASQNQRSVVSTLFIYVILCIVEFVAIGRRQSLKDSLKSLFCW